MTYPIEHEPIWINWKRSERGGLRVIAYTDEDGQPFLGVAELDAEGEMIAPPVYQSGRQWRTTAIIDNKLLKFWAEVTPVSLQMFFKEIPAHNHQGEGRAVAWGAPTPEANF